MRERRVSSQGLAAAVGVHETTVAHWRTGADTPMLDTAARIAEELHRPALFEMVKAERTRECEECRAPFVTNSRHAARRRFCGANCQERAWYRRTRSPEARFGVTARNKLRIYQEAVAAFCAVCEPEGLCRTPSCELRPVSPLPLRKAA